MNEKVSGFRNEGSVFVTEKSHMEDLLKIIGQYAKVNAKTVTKDWPRDHDIVGWEIEFEPLVESLNSNSVTTYN